MQLLRRGWHVLFTLPVLLAMVVAGGAQAAPRAHAAAAPVKVIAGKLLKTSKGLTIYVFAADSADKSTCYGPCAKYWPPVLIPKGTMPPAKMAGIAGTFGVTMRTDGTQQLTYDKAPLYTFIKDKDSGDFYGQGVVASGGFWWAVVAPPAS